MIVESKLTELEPLRNKIGHNRPVTYISTEGRQEKEALNGQETAGQSTSFTSE